MMQFQFKSYGEDAAGSEEVEYGRFHSDSAAKAWAGRKARKINGPVDIARAGSAPWEERYLTTASPAPKSVWVAGYRFERLD